MFQAMRQKTTRVGVINAKKRKEMIKTLEVKINNIIDELAFLQREKDEESLVRLSELTQQRDRLLYRLERISQTSTAGSLANNKIDIGHEVTLRVGKQKVKVSIVGEYEVNSSRGHISSVSPLGRQLLNRKVGETIYVKTPSGRQEYQIMEVK